MRELRTQFHQQMGETEGKVIQLFGLVAEDLAAATHALLSGDHEVVATLSERERLIDSVHHNIEELINTQLALQAPVAADLRFLLSVLRIVPELERSHDLVIHIASHADRGLSEQLTPRCRGLVEQMGSIAADMWRQTSDSWYQRDADAAVVLDERDDQLDALHNALTTELATGQLPTVVTMSMTLVARFYERLGDHAVNIARRVSYLAGRHLEPK